VPGNLVSATLRGGLFTRVVGQRILFFQKLTSTMDEAARQAEGAYGRPPVPDGTVVVAETQTASRGRFQRHWVSQPGNLYLSVVFRPTLQALPSLSILSGVAVARAIRKTTGLNPRIKWPNDILLDGKKIAGILVESVLEGEAVRYAAVGIGINVSLDTNEINEIASFATSLNAATGDAVSREALLRHLLQDLDALYLQLGQGKSPLLEWKSLLETLGQRVRVACRDEIYVGLAEDVDPVGQLTLRLDDGEPVSLSAGDVTLQGSATESPRHRE